MTPEKLKKKCKFCGQVTYENTMGTPGNSCPERDAFYATHAWQSVR